MRKPETVLPCAFIGRLSQATSFARAVPVVAHALQLAAAATAAAHATPKTA